METGSQRSLNLINKRNGKFQSVDEHYKAFEISNKLGIGVDAFTMIYPWEDEEDLEKTRKMVEFVAHNKVCALDENGLEMKNNVDSTIMTLYQGTAFYDMISQGELPDVVLKLDFNSGELFYKENHGGSGWPYSKTRLPSTRYVEEQIYRSSLRPKNK